MKKDDINKKLEELYAELKKEKAISSRYSLIRLFLLAAALFSIYYGYYYASWFYMLLLAAVVLFFWFVHLHTNVKKEIELKEAIANVYQDILARQGEDWKQFEDIGLDFLTDSMTQAIDLDLLGPSSLFQYLCVAKTISGREQLFNLFHVKYISKAEIELRQQAVRELAENETFSVELTAHLKLFERHARKKKKQTIQDVYAYMEEEHRLYPTIVQGITYLLSSVTVLCLVLSLTGHLSFSYFMMLAVLSLAVALLSVLKNNAIFSSIRALDHMMSDYERMFTCLENTSFHSILLKQAVDDVQDASKAIRKLHHIMTGVQLRNDGITFLLVNALFLLDFHCVFALERWKKAYGNQLRVWMDALGRIEALVSLAHLFYAKQNCCIPTCIDSDRPTLQMQEAYHPLICEEIAVANSFCAEPASYVITGSNMSGKTTFLRTIGLNMILFHAGAAVCAKQFSASSMSIYTSMRVRDDVSEGISTFYAEILRIKQMITESEQQEPMLILIDEIFKGTNSADRILCAKEVLRQLHLPWVISLVSTHDFELCSLQFDQKETVKNYHFSEFYKEDEIHFDYRLKDGKCKTTNARQLLQMAGIDGAFAEE